MDISEKNLEDIIEQVLLSYEIVGPPDDPNLLLHQPPPLYGPTTSKLTPDNVKPGGYHKHISEEYDKSLCLIAEDVLVSRYVGAEFVQPGFTIQFDLRTLDVGDLSGVVKERRAIHQPHGGFNQLLCCRTCLYL